MYYSAGEPPCVHHTFCHAKAIATMLEAGSAPTHGRQPLPREQAQPITFFPSTKTTLVHSNKWHATFTAYPFDYVVDGHPTGGALSMLYHETIGPIAVGTMTEYSLVEPNNMQIPQMVENICQTLRIESQEDGVFYRSVSDKLAVVETNLEDNRVLVSVRGTLRNTEQKGTESFAISCVFEENRVTVTAESSVQTGKFIFPIIGSAMESAETVSENEKRIYRKQGQITLKSDEEIKMRTEESPRLNPYAKRFSNDKFDRTFHPVGGFETIMLYATLTKNKPIVLEINV